MQGFLHRGMWGGGATMATGVVHHGGQKYMTGLLTYVSISEIFGVCFIVTGCFVDGRSVERTFGRKDVSSTDFCRMDVWSKIVDSYMYTT